MKTKHAPFSLYKKKIGTKQFWYVRFWNPQQREYTIHRATGIEVGGKRERKSEAEKIAAGMLAGITFNAQHTTLLLYLKSFWDENSPYFKESAIVSKRPPSKEYIRASQRSLALHIEPYPPFKRISLDELTPALLRSFMLWLSDRGASANTINRAFHTIRMPLRDAISRDEAKLDPFTKIKYAAIKRREKGVLTLEEAKRFMELPISDLRKHLVVGLGLFCGMRQGEIRGLHWVDIIGDYIYICHNWQELDGLKSPKYDSNRKVPIISFLKKLIEEFWQQQNKPTEGLVFWRSSKDKPLSSGYFRKTTNEMLGKIGIAGAWLSRKPMPADYVNEQAARNITLHSLRHTFVSLSRLAGLADVEVQAMSGHKSLEMLGVYTHAKQVTQLEACRNVFEQTFKNNAKDIADIVDRGVDNFSYMI